MLRKFLLLFCLISNFYTYSQENLVLNPSFEDVSGQLKCYLYDVGKFPITNWTSASEGSIDAFSMKLSSKCIMYPLNDTFADQKPRTGNNFVGFTSIYNDTKEYREYVRGNLSKPLEVGATYKIQFYVCLSAFASAATNNIGLAFINNKVPIYSHVDPLPIKPDVNYSGKPITQTEKWTPLTFEFTATKPNLDAFIIGNFFKSQETDFKIVSEKLPIESYMLIDDVSIFKIDGPKVEILFDLPSEVCEGTILQLPSISKNGISGSWSPVFDPFKTQIYTFTSDTNSKTEVEIKVIPNFTFELINFCQNYQFKVEVKQDNLPIKNFKWKLNGTELSYQSLSLNVSDFSEFFKDNNILEFTVFNDKGCENTKSITFSGSNLCTIQKEVSPNNDGIDDSLDLSSFGRVKFKLFNRFGNVVYENDNYRSQWNGQLSDGAKLPAGSYYYQVETSTDEILNGWINLIY